LSGAIAKLASFNLQKLVLSPTGSINLGFILREDLLLCSSYLPLGVPNWADIYTPSESNLQKGVFHGKLPWSPWTLFVKPRSDIFYRSLSIIHIGATHYGYFSPHANMPRHPNSFYWLSLIPTICLDYARIHVIYSLLTPPLLAIHLHLHSRI
jgi:hypothetical protein